MTPIVYRAAAKLLHRLPVRKGRLAESLTGRRGAAQRWADWASRERTDGPLVWVHGASVGEGLTALPIVTRLRASVPEIAVVHTYSSPSVARWTGTFGADRSDYVPLDEPCEVACALEPLDPDLLVFSRGDLWPELVAGANAADVPVAVVGATVRPSSNRLRWPARRILTVTHQSLRWVGAASDDDATRWIRLGVRRTAVTVTGDPRHDQVIERIPRLRTVEPLRGWSNARSVLVAGSVDRLDARVLLQAFERVCHAHPCAGLMLVPHEPTDENVAGLAALARQFRIEAHRWSGGIPDSNACCIIVTKLGVLADLYVQATIAYVGGGFRRGRLHSTIEPAAYAVPIMFGPHYESSVDATRLMAEGGAVALEEDPVDSCRALWARWIESPTTRTQAGLSARSVLRQGAARVSVEYLLELLRG